MKPFFFGFASFKVQSSNCAFFRRKKFIMYSTLQPSIHPLFYERRIYGLFSKAWYKQQHSFFRETKNHLTRCKVIAGFCFFVSSATTDKIISPELNENIKHQPGDEILVVFTSTLPQFTIDIFKADDLWPLIFILKAMEIDMKVSKK